MSSPAASASVSAIAGRWRPSPSLILADEPTSIARRVDSPHDQYDLLLTLQRSRFAFPSSSSPTPSALPTT